jgi:hypothetical protein
MPNLPIQNSNLPQGFCASDYQSILNAFSAAQFVNVNTVAGVIVSSTPPADHTSAWLQLDSNGRPTRIYFFAQGAWLSLHPLPPGFTMIWNQVLPNFQTFDGGDATAAPYSAVSGQMWQLMATTLDGLGTQVAQAQFPVGVGTLPSTTPIAVGGTGGEEKHILTPAEQGNIVASVTTDVESAGNDHKVLDTLTLNGIAMNNANLGPSTIPLAGTVAAHNTLPPYYGVYFLQRTSRLFYTV